MYDCTKNYIGGEWTASSGGTLRDVVNPATEAPVGQVSFGTAEDVDRAVGAARTAFAEYSRWSVRQRLDLLARIVESYKQRYDDLAAAITAEMGAPARFALKAQAGSGLGHLKVAMAALETFEFEEPAGRRLDTAAARQDPRERRGGLLRLEEGDVAAIRLPGQRFLVEEDRRREARRLVETRGRRPC